VHLAIAVVVVRSVDGYTKLIQHGRHRSTVAAGAPLEANIGLRDQTHADDNSFIAGPSTPFNTAFSTWSIACAGRRLPPQSQTLPGPCPGTRRLLSQSATIRKFVWVCGCTEPLLRFFDKRKGHLTYRSMPVRGVAHPIASRY
jgi:hypothetical protein